MGKSTDQTNNLQSLYITIQSASDTKIVLYQQTEEFKFKLSSFSLLIANKSQPFFADIDGDLK
jgi:hypothetical protein